MTVLSRRLCMEDVYRTKGPQIVEDRHRQLTTYTAYFDGWFEGQYGDYKSALARLFPVEQFGYPVAYFTLSPDGEPGLAFCNKCAAHSWSDGADDGFIVEAINESDCEFYCFVCGKVIPTE